MEDKLPPWTHRFPVLPKITEWIFHCLHTKPKWEIGENVQFLRMEGSASFEEFPLASAYCTAIIGSERVLMKYIAGQTAFAQSNANGKWVICTRVVFVLPYSQAYRGKNWYKWSTAAVSVRRGFSLWAQPQQSLVRCVEHWSKAPSPPPSSPSPPPRLLNVPYKGLVSCCPKPRPDELHKSPRSCSQQTKP